jgi:glutaredoxin
MSVDVIIFTMNGCGHCHDLKKELNKLKISFNEIDISNNKKIWDQVIQQTGDNVVPTIYITEKNTDKGVVFIPGKDFNNKDEGINLIKKYIL